MLVREPLVRLAPKVVGGHQFQEGGGVGEPWVPPDEGVVPRVGRLGAEDHPVPPEGPERVPDYPRLKVEVFLPQGEVDVLVLPQEQLAPRHIHIRPGVEDVHLRPEAPGKDEAGGVVHGQPTGSGLQMDIVRQPAAGLHGAVQIHVVVVPGAAGLAPGLDVPGEAPGQLVQVVPRPGRVSRPSPLGHPDQKFPDDLGRIGPHHRKPGNEAPGLPDFQVPVQSIGGVRGKLGRRAEDKEEKQENRNQRRFAIHCFSPETRWAMIP
ncbi:MAG: hypothetical protein BWY88_01288 [Synergistetes bacterium ADurb.Bin520]|nr:MAG: hypothetical protein BWY88_01288 [Synergistetes bacterium ADurb.Bin520]